ncbi:MAG: metallopeptidase family protein [Armatimonadota bacterium]|nr:metallopeptidase family protein [Armatimonadota bacterium]
MRISRRRFEEVVEQALCAVPAELRRAVENVEIVVEDWPTEEQLGSVGLAEGDSLFGLYEGVPLPERGLDPPLLPDRITLFQGPLEAACDTDDELREEIRRTLVHELAHYFGFDEDRIEELGYG